MPWVCNYYVTLRCNAWCNFCNIPQTNNANPPPEPTLEQLEQNLRDLKRLGVKIVDFTGGEPTLYRNIVAAASMAKDMGFVTAMTNNGMLYPKYADALEGKIDALVFSLESPDREENDRIRGVKCYDKVLESIRISHEKGQDVFLGHVVTNEVMHRLDDMIAFARSLDAILYLAPAYSFFGNEGLSKSNAEKLMKYFNAPGVVLDRAQLKLIMSGGNRRDDPDCRAISSTVVISPDNKLLLPCYHFKQEGLPIDGNLYSLYHSRAVQAARAMEGRHDFCEGCTVYCYMRGSLFWKYPMDSFTMGLHYFGERILQKVRKRVRGLPSIPVAAKPTTSRPIAPTAARVITTVPLKPRVSLPVVPVRPPIPPAE
ncbi:MAG: radical SAM protein [Sandaracinaceae bacterium]|nr:radical SAM protein [Sandaracinaceae bacterium]